MLVEPVSFGPSSSAATRRRTAEPRIDDYAERTKQIVTTWKGIDGKHDGDAAKLADALVKLVALKERSALIVSGELHW